MDDESAPHEAHLNPRTKRVRRLILDSAIEVLLESEVPWPGFDSPRGRFVASLGSTLLPPLLVPPLPRSLRFVE